MPKLLSIRTTSTAARAALANQLVKRLPEMDKDQDGWVSAPEVDAFGQKLGFTSEERTDLLDTVLLRAAFTGSDPLWWGGQEASVKENLARVIAGRESPLNSLTVAAENLRRRAAEGQEAATELLDAFLDEAAVRILADDLKRRLDTADRDGDGYVTAPEMWDVAKAMVGDDASEDLLHLPLMLALTEVSPPAGKPGRWFNAATVPGAKQAVDHEVAAFAQEASASNPLAVLVDAVRAQAVVLHASLPASRQGLDETRAALVREVRVLEAANKTKAHDVSILLEQIGSRKAEIEREHRRKRNIGILGILAGVPAVGVLSLVEMQRDDRRIKDLEAELSAARAEQQKIEGRLADYARLKDKIEAKLEAAVVQDTRTPVPDAPADLAAALEAAEIERFQQAQIDALKTQIALLTTLRDEARAIGLELDALIGSLGQTLADAERALAESQKATEKLFQVLIDDDPHAAAMKALRKMAAAEVAKAVDKMLAGRRLRPELKKEIKKRFVAAILGDR